jgi:hypothetical protein
VIRAVAGKPSAGIRPFRAGDYSFNNIGISSCFMLLSTMDPADRARRGYYAVGGCGGNIAWHTEDDTLPIADRDILLTDMRIYAAAVMEAANATVAPFDFRATLDEFAATLSGYQHAVGDALSFAQARAAIDGLRPSLDRLRDRAAALADRPASDPEVRRLNAAVRRLARHLVPVNFTSRPRFFHDRAESIPPLPDLAPALTYPSTPPERIGFLRTHLVRGQNRLVAALHEAKRDVDLALA